MFALVIIAISVVGLLSVVNIFAFVDTDNKDVKLLSAVNFISLVLAIVTMSLVLNAKF